MKALLKKFLGKIVLFIYLRPKFKKLIIQVIFKLDLSQKIKLWLNDLSIDAGLVNQAFHKSPLLFQRLTPRAKAIYNDLIETIKSQSRL